MESYSFLTLSTTSVNFYKAKDSGKQKLHLPVMGFYLHSFEFVTTCLHQSRTLFCFLRPIAVLFYKLHFVTFFVVFKIPALPNQIDFFLSKELVTGTAKWKLRRETSPAYHVCYEI